MKNLLNFKDFLNENVSASTSLGELILKFLWVRDQAHIFHWQTKSNSIHTTLGDFYELYLEKIDELVECIFGMTEETFKIGTGSIELVDLSEDSLDVYKKTVVDIFESDFPKIFQKTDKTENLYNIINDILGELNKLKYLLSQK